MPLQKITLAPGIQGQASPTANEGGWSLGNLVRFRQGRPEKWRGWARYTATTFLGAIRGMLTLYELAGDALLALGSHTNLYMVRGGTSYDITPVDRTVAVGAAGIAVVSLSPLVTVTTSTAHGLAAGDAFTFDTIAGQTRTPAALTLGGVSFGNRDFTVLSVTGANSFTFQLHTAASATTTGGSVTLTAFMPAGPLDATPGLGWGAGGYGISAYGAAANVASTVLPARMWSLEPWGQTLLACPTNGRLIAWSPDSAGNVTTRGAYVIGGIAEHGPPLVNGGVVVGMPERHAILFGCASLNSRDNFDPMLVRFSDLEDYGSWNPTSTNSAGSFRLQGGGAIMGWLNSTLQTLIWTDTSLWTMRFIGLPYVYSFNKSDGNCGLISQNGRAEMGGVVYWMGPTGFWRFQGGAPAQLPCSLQDEVFDNLNRSQQTKVYAGVNTANGEILWFYPAAGNEIDRFIAYNTRENTWYGGILSRTAWLDRGPTGLPMAATADGRVYQHETGVDADGEAMGEYLESGFFDLEDGENVLFLDRFIPDFQHFTGSLTVSFKVAEYPAKAPRVLGPYTVTPDTKFIPFRARGRQASLRIDGGPKGSHWRMGAPRVSVQPDGRR